MTRRLSVLVCSGELSGDRLVERLVPALRRLVPEELQLKVITARPITGLKEGEVLASGIEGVQAWRNTLRQVLEWTKSDPPDLLVGISHHAFNILLAIEMRELAPGIRTVMVAPPEIWAWQVRSFGRALGPVLCRWFGRRRGLAFVLASMLDRGRTVLESFDAVACLFEPGERAYRRRAQQLGNDRVRVVRVGHPFAEYADPEVRSRLECEAQDLRRQLGVAAGGQVVGLFPGSRRREIERIFPLMVRAVDRLPAGCGAPLVIVSVADDDCEEQIRGLLSQADGHRRIAIVPVGSDVVLEACDQALLCSGTMTLQAACLGVPSVVIYRRDWDRVGEIVFKIVASQPRIIRSPGSGALTVVLANILLGERLQTQLVLRDCNPKSVAAALLVLMEDPEESCRARRGQRALLPLLSPGEESGLAGAEDGRDGPMDRVARLVVGLVDVRSE